VIEKMQLKVYDNCGLDGKKDAIVASVMRKSHKAGLSGNRQKTMGER
jgi:hypothetical protein